ncbi:MAG TPA: hypothetical protein VFW87_04905 [Pirellulales bacterium]|nr:hypothetical protein [Pirellulales bacterium]
MAPNRKLLLRNKKNGRLGLGGDRFAAARGIFLSSIFLCSIGSAQPIAPQVASETRPSLHFLPDECLG